MIDTNEKAIAAVVEKAEEIPDPSNDQVESTGADPGAPPHPAQKQAEILVELAKQAKLFHAAHGKAYADPLIDGHRETWPGRGRNFTRWLTREYYRETSRAPSSQARQSALNVIEAKAQYDGPERRVHVRLAAHEGKFYVDLADDGWQAVEIDQSGWRVVSAPPVRFRRPAGMLALPEPQRSGSVDLLRPFLNVGSDDDFVLVVMWALAVLRDDCPYAVIALSGEQGSAKSTFSKILRALLDPNQAPLRTIPKKEEDLIIAADHGRILAYDNISTLSPGLSDALCRIATGGGFGTRRFYTNDEEVIFNVTRPIILNGIENCVTRNDLADRAIFLTLEPIPDDQRRPEKDLWSAFAAAHPSILGALLDAVSDGMRRLPDIHLETLPRMSDFALFAVQGWRREKIYPDFIFAVQRADGSNRIAVLEMKGEHLAGNADTEYKKSVLQLLSKNFMWDQTPPAGTLELVQDNGETVECDLVLMKDWKKKLPKFMQAAP